MKIAELRPPAPALTGPEEHRLKRETRDLREQLKDALNKLEMSERLGGFLNDLASARIDTPRWTQPHRALKKHEVIPTACFSDWHLDEVVKPEQVYHRNGYDRAIAERRLRLYFENICKVARDYVKGFHYPGICFPMLGDNFSGHIHEELRNTNADVMLSSLLHWIGPVTSGLRLLADEFGHVWVPAVVGNHGRNSIKPIAKMRARDNFDWLFASLLRRELKDDRRFSWGVSEAHKFAYSLFHTRFIISHGDECKGGSGIAGMLSPQLIAAARMRKTHEFDYWLLGHWHQRGAYRGIRVNGTGKGWDEYAALLNFDFQVPQQDFFLTDPHRGIIADWPIFVECPDEPWRQAPRELPGKRCSIQ
jgi:hypothetical protein